MLYCRKKKEKKKEERRRKADARPTRIDDTIQSRFEEKLGENDRGSRSRRFERRARVRSTIRDNYGTKTLCSLEDVEKVQKPGINVKTGSTSYDRRRRSPVFAGSRRSKLEETKRERKEEMLFFRKICLDRPDSSNARLFSLV